MEWKTVEANGTTWIVSDSGLVRTPAHTGIVKRVRKGVSQEFDAEYPERDLSPYLTRSGYLEVCQKRNTKRFKASAHRLVGIGFVYGYAPGLSINHIDGNKTNNHPSNLEWVSLARNTQHQWEIGLVDLRGDAHPSKKLSSRQVVYIRRLLAHGVSAHSLAVIAGVSQPLIAFIRDGKRWPTVTHGRPVVVEH